MKPANDEESKKEEKGSKITYKPKFDARKASKLIEIALKNSDVLKLTKEGHLKRRLPFKST